MWMKTGFASYTVIQIGVACELNLLGRFDLGKDMLNPLTPSLCQMLRKRGCLDGLLYSRTCIPWRILEY